MSLTTGRPSKKSTDKLELSDVTIIQKNSAREL